LGIRWIFGLTTEQGLRGDFAGEFGIHEAGMRCDADAAEVQPVGIPTGADGGVVVMVAGGVPGAGMVKEFEMLVGQIEEFSAQRERERGTACAVVGVVTIVFPAAVVKEGEKAHDRDDGLAVCGDDECIPLDPPPVGRAVDRMRWECRGQGGHVLPEPLEIDGDGVRFHF
jgi:hypothetical protein